MTSQRRRAMIAPGGAGEDLSVLHSAGEDEALKAEIAKYARDVMQQHE